MNNNALLHCLVLTGMLLGACAAPTGQDEPPVAAIVNVDCAPWDGAAFTITVPIDSGGLISLSIYQAPDIQRRSVFVFPDSTWRVGYAYYRPEFGPEEPLAGRVTLRRVTRGVPLDGVFDLQSQVGFRYHLRFLATWDRQHVGCG